MALSTAPSEPLDEAMPPAESFRYPYGHAPEARPAGQTDSCCDESVKARPPRVMSESI